MRIFNQVRRVLLRDGKFKNYLIYALGEIVLVVIGILIALQINNWNGDRKSRIEGAKAVEVLLQSFEKNSFAIEDIEEELEYTLKVTELRIEKSNQHPNTLSQNVIDSVRVLNMIKLGLADNLESRTLLKNVNMSLISKEVRELLLEYGSALNIYRTVEDNFNELILEQRKNHQKYIALIRELKSTKKLKVNYLNWLEDLDNQNMSVETLWKLETLRTKLSTLKEKNNLVIRQLKRKMEA